MKVHLLRDDTPYRLCGFVQKGEKLCAVQIIWVLGWVYSGSKTRVADKGGNAENIGTCVIYLYTIC